MKPEELKARTKEFGLRVIRLVTSLPRGLVTDVIAKQLLRAGTSVGANYRAACRARSRRDFVAKMGIVEEEADESLYWMEMLAEAGFVKLHKVAPLMQEASELTAVAVASITTARRRAVR